MMTIALTMLVLACSKGDPMIEVNALIGQGKISQAKIKFEELVEREQDPNLERKFIQFCFEHQQYQDFSRVASDYLNRFPDDAEIKNLQFEHYALLAKNAEQRKDYALAVDYIVKKLLNVEYADHGKWEKRLTSILSKWYQAEKEKGDSNGQREAISRMRDLKFDNLANDLDPELFKAESGK
jgi:hypothetical protein